MTDAPKLKWTDLFGMDPDYPMSRDREEELLADLMRRILTGADGYINLSPPPELVEDDDPTPVTLTVDGSFWVEGETETLLRRILTDPACQPSAEGGSNHEGTTA